MQTTMLTLCTVMILLGIFESVSSSISTKVAFGSCDFPGISAPIFKQIAARKPDIFIWNGDATYIDYASSDSKSSWNVFARTFWKPPKPALLSEWPHLYNTTKQDPSYRLLLDTNCSIAGTYDDHDFGRDNTFGSWQHKDYSQSVFLDFLDVPQHDPKRNQEGLYEHFPFKVEMNQNVTKTIDIILLDIRYFAQLESKEDILGSTQWSWLYHVVQNETHGELLLIVSGLQILPVGQSALASWGREFAESQRELFELLLKYNTNKRVLFVTGDIHRGETLQMQCINQKNGRIQNLYEVTSSGLTHSVADSCYLYRQLFAMDSYCRYDGTVMCEYNARNFGEVSIEWGWNTDLNDFEIVSAYSSVFDINGNAQCVSELPLWNDNAALDYDRDDSMYAVQTFGDYKCYGGKKQYSLANVVEKEITLCWIQFVCFGQCGALALFYFTTFALSIIKWVHPSNKIVSWMNNTQ